MTQEKSNPPPTSEILPLAQNKIYMPLHLGLLGYLILACMTQSSRWQLSLILSRQKWCEWGGIYFNTTTTELFFI